MTDDLSLSTPTFASPPTATQPSAQRADVSPGEAMISMSGLKKAFGDKVVLDGVDLTIGKGESMVIIGGSGSGKSVMLKCLLGLIRPDGGSITINGVDTTRLSGRARLASMEHMGMLFQGAALFDSLPVWHNIGFALLQRGGLTKGQVREIALEKLAMVGLDDSVATLMPSELSGGMQKRVALARAIATDPDIIFFDEPTTGLDPIMSDVINDLIVRCVRKLGATALSITHDMASARKIGDRIAMLYQGRIIWDGPAGDVTMSDNPYVDQFVNGRAEGPIEMPVLAR